MVEIPLFIFAGQSNMVGPLNAGKVPGLSGVYMHNSYSWGRSGPEYNFIRTLQENGIEEMAVVKTAWGGTGLTPHADRNDWSPETEGELFDKMIADTLDMIRSLRAKGYEPKLEGLFWMQGEAEASASRSGSFSENMRHFIESVRAALDAPDLPVYMGEIADNPSNPYSDDVQAGQQKLADEMDNVYLIQTDGFELTDNVHFSEAGSFMLGQGMADAYLNGLSDTLADRSSMLVINGNAADNTIRGNDSHQVIRAGAGDDTVYGGGGNDLITGGDGNDFLFGENGDDVINGGNGDDIIFGGNGNDRLNGAAGNDRLVGGNGDDAIRGGSGNDLLYGGNGADLLYGDAGNDRLYGEDGDDTLVAGLGTDTLSGGAGRDLFYMGLSTQKDSTNIANIIDFQEGLDTVQFWLASRPQADFMKVESGKTVIETMANATGQKNKIVFDHVIDVQVNVYEIDGKFLVELV